MNKSGTILGIAAGVFLLVAFVLPWFVEPSIYIITLVIATVAFLGIWYFIILKKRNLL